MEPLEVWTCQRAENLKKNIFDVSLFSNFHIFCLPFFLLSCSVLPSFLRLFFLPPFQPEVYIMENLMAAFQANSGVARGGQVRQVAPVAMGRGSQNEQ